MSDLYYKDYNGVLVPNPLKDTEQVLHVAHPTGGDDSDIIQEKLNDGKGGVVVLPPFNYKVSRTIYVPENTTFKGYGKGSKITLLSAENLDEIPFRTRNGNSDVMPVITNERPNEGETTKRVIISNISVSGEGVVNSVSTRMAGILYADAEDCEMLNVYVNYINWSPEHNVDKRGFGVACVRARNIVFNGGTIDNCGYECLGVYDDSKSVIVTNMVLKTGMRCSAQIHQNTSNILVTNNIFDMEMADTYTHGCLLFHGREDDEVKNVMVTNNYFTSVEGSLALVSNVEKAEGVSIHDNIIEANECYAINDSALNNQGISDLSLKGNRIIFNNIIKGSVAIRLSRLCGMNLISGNSIKGDRGVLRVDEFDYLSVNQNMIKSGISYGIRLGEVNGKAVIRDNFIEAEDAFHEDYDNTPNVELDGNIIIAS